MTINWVILDECLLWENRGIYLVDRRGRVRLAGPRPLCIDGREYRRRTGNRRRR